MLKVHPIILSGGSGTRLWPLSRKSYPKQFSSLIGEHSLFQETALRLSDPAYAAPVVVTGEDFRFIVTEQLKKIGISAAKTLIEPAPRNTAPAILASALSVIQDDPEGLLLVIPSDHKLPDNHLFLEAVQAGIPEAMAGNFITFGIRPTRPETGYGWLALPDNCPTDFPLRPLPLQGFVEKPDQKTAEAFLAGRKHLWNAGIFLFSARTLIAAFERIKPDMLSSVRRALENGWADLNFFRLSPQHWDDVENISIDYAVMETADNMRVVPYSGAWSDMGDWDAIWRDGEADARGVVVSGQATAIDCDNMLLYAENQHQRLVSIGVSDIIAVAMPDAVLLVHKDRAQEVKQAVDLLKHDQVPQAETLPRAYRPWGWYESLAMGDRFQVKRIHVNPGAALSLQSHHHRSEHWVVVQGTAKITVDGQEKLLTENQSIYIPLGAVHRMENPGKLPMVLIEVQTGAYLGEDDIIRYEDIYARGAVDNSK